MSSEIAEALARVRTEVKNSHIIRSQQIQRSDRELLVRTKWLQEIIRGWYLLVKPDSRPGDSSIWYANFWEFLKIYLEYHFQDAYCLSAESSLDLHTAATTIPKQVIAITAKGGGMPQELPFNTSILVYADPGNLPEEKNAVNGLNIMTLPYALCKVSPTYFQKSPKDAEIALKLIRNSSDLTQILLKYSFKSAAARLIGAYEFLGNEEMAQEISQELTFAGWKIRSENPFSIASPFLSNQKIQSPYAARIRSLWSEYREKIIPYFSHFQRFNNLQIALSHLEDLYDRDAYNSLSIEGYEVDNDLILRVQNHEWNPDDPKDGDERNALAARGYYEAFLEVKKSVEDLGQTNPGEIIQRDLKKWYKSLFAPQLRAGILRNENLIGYRRGQVFIRNSRHVPLPKEALIDAMETFFQCLKDEPDASVRALLGHYIFVFIHPYTDGNGRLGRFLMNAMFLSGGYPWTIIEVKHRSEYLSALETASTEQNIEPFAEFVAKEMHKSYKH